MTRPVPPRPAPARLPRRGESAVVLPPRIRRHLTAFLAVPLASFGSLLLGVAGEDEPVGIDRPVGDWLRLHLRAVEGAARAVTQLGSPVGAGLICTALALLCLRRPAGGPRVIGPAAVAVLGPAMAGALTTFVFKPLADRHLGEYLAYPSGHTTGAVSVATVAVLLLRPGGVLGRSLQPRLARFCCVLVAVLAVAVEVALVALHYHYPTDVVGGTAVGFGAVLVVAALVDRSTAAPADGSAQRVPVARSSSSHESE